MLCGLPLLFQKPLQTTKKQSHIATPLKYLRAARRVQCSDTGKVAHAKGVPVVVDNTFGAGGFFCQPIKHGCSLISWSAENGLTTI